MPTLYVLISTLSGTHLASQFFDELLYPLLWELGFKKGSHTVIWTSNAHSVKNFAKEVLFPNAIRGYRQTVLMLSGDGGTVDIINELYKNKDGYHERLVFLLSHHLTCTDLQKFLREAYPLLVSARHRQCFVSFYTQTTQIAIYIHTIPSYLPHQRVCTASHIPSHIFPRSASSVKPGPNTYPYS